MLLRFAERGKEKTILSLSAVNGKRTRRKGETPCPRAQGGKARKRACRVRQKLERVYEETSTWADGPCKLSQGSPALYRPRLSCRHRPTYGSAGQITCAETLC